jgi:hypothetical protein
MHFNGSRGVALFFGGLWAISRGIAYLPPLIPNATYVPGSLTLISATIPLPAWGALWVVVGAICAFSAFLKNDTFAWSVLVGMGVTWGLAYAASSAMSIVNGDPGREWIAAGSYLFPAIIFAILSARIPDRTK